MYTGTGTGSAFCQGSYGWPAVIHLLTLATRVVRAIERIANNVETNR